MAEADERPQGSDSPPLKLPDFVTNIFSFLQPKAPPAVIDAGVPKPTGEKDRQNSTVETVSFPYNPPTNTEPLKVEAEVSSSKTSNNLVIWQVYALGGFLVLKWAWARWNERNERSNKKDATDDDDQPSHREGGDSDDDQHED
ncbi:unnamed protein product [Microthlaspi erraticum]|uniref:Uncharacterized protein n=1 Tax=Microthlaspi erraticum TaxID=1685480 RepID=A0A6D2HZ03_9BRAS|nr:unnamed protein product [Microthlaspi erraticum]